MTVQIAPETEVVREAAQILLQHLSPTKVARFWASWQAGHGDYLQWRDQTFANATVDELYDQVVEFQQRMHP
ncbi:MAG: hypothetical protein M3Q45_05755 [Chloroflexota bacterium]|nr:hypothetical protein [Chloroflexota bacterium]